RRCERRLVRLRCIVCWLLFVRFFCFFFDCYGDHRDLHSFPTRRSSDLTYASGVWFAPNRSAILLPSSLRIANVRCLKMTVTRLRSEEHTSELQSLRHLVCRLLLEKKKNRRAPATQQAPATIGERAVNCR